RGGGCAAGDALGLELMRRPPHAARHRRAGEYAVRVDTPRRERVTCGEAAFTSPRGGRPLGAITAAIPSTRTRGELMRVLVTGHNGYSGSVRVERLSG